MSHVGIIETLQKSSIWWFKGPESNVIEDNLYTWPTTTSKWSVTAQKSNKMTKFELNMLKVTPIFRTRKWFLTQYFISSCEKIYSHERNDETLGEMHPISRASRTRGGYLLGEIPYQRTQRNSSLVYLRTKEDWVHARNKILSWGPTDQKKLKNLKTCFKCLEMRENFNAKRDYRLLIGGS